MVADDGGGLPSGPGLVAKGPRDPDLYKVDRVPSVSWASAPVTLKAVVGKVRPQGAPCVHIHDLKAPTNTETGQAKFIDGIKQTVFDLSLIHI